MEHDVWAFKHEKNYGVRLLTPRAKDWFRSHAQVFADFDPNQTIYMTLEDFVVFESELHETNLLCIIDGERMH